MRAGHKLFTVSIRNAAAAADRIAKSPHTSGEGNVS
jgi:hypothetical protein